MRIISVVPSLTELLYDLDLDNQVVGITKFCVHPEEWFRTKERIGGTKNLNIEKISALKPDLILANKEENVKEQVELLQEFCPVYVTDIKSPIDCTEMIRKLGQLTQKREAAEVLAEKYNQCLKKIKHPGNPKKVIYLIWRKPYMTVGGDTYINSMLEHMGFQNLMAGHTRYPEITEQTLRDSDADIIMLSSEPYPFKEMHAEEIQKINPSTLCQCVNGELFSWYGSRILHLSSYANDLLNTLHEQKQ